MKKFFWLNTVILAFFIFDRILKEIALRGFVSKTAFFKFFYFPNINIALSIPLRGFLFYFLLIIIIFIIIIKLNQAYEKGKTFEVFSWTAILVGAFSNLLDRFKYGAVIDYLDFFFVVINIADIMIFSAVTLLLYQLVLSRFLAKKS